MSSISNPADDVVDLLRQLRLPHLRAAAQRGHAHSTIAAAMLDRLLHRSVVFNITGDSYRMRAHQARNRKLTEGGPA